MTETYAQSSHKKSSQQNCILLQLIKEEGESEEIDNVSCLVVQWIKDLALLPLWPCCNCSTGSILGLRTSTCCGWGQMTTKNKYIMLTWEFLFKICFIRQFMNWAKSLLASRMVLWRSLFFFFFLPFLELLLRHMEVPRLGIKSEL